MKRIYKLKINHDSFTVVFHRKATEIFRLKFFAKKKFSLIMTWRSIIFLIMVPLGTNKESLSFPTAFTGVWGVPKRFKGVKGSGFRVRI